MASARKRPRRRRRYPQQAGQRAMTEVSVALGANLAEPEQQILKCYRSALQSIPERNCWPVHHCSSSPMGPQDQPDYVNAVVRLKTSLAPHALLDELQRIELDQGRYVKMNVGATHTGSGFLLFGQQIDR